MSRKRARLAILLLLLASPVLAGEIRGECDLRFLGTSTLHDFEGTVSCLSFSAETETDSAGKSILSDVEVEIPVAGMNTGNGSRDEQMRKMFDGSHYPRIRGTARNVDIEAIRQAVRKGPAPLDLLLRIRDVERPVHATVTGLREEGTEARFDLEFPVSLREFGLKAPSVLFFIRVGDRVDVRGNFRVERTSKE